MTNYWLHRISHHAEISNPLLNKGYLTIGFSSIKNRHDFLQKIQQNEEYKYFDQEFETAFGEKLRSRWSLWRFIAKMKKDDYVIVPSAGILSIYKILEEAKPVDILKIGLYGKKEQGLFFNKDNKEVDLGFFIKVEKDTINIPRKKYADAKLTSRLKIRNTNVLVSDLKDSIENAKKNYNANKPLNLIFEIKEEIKKTVLKKIKETTNPEDLEILVKNYFEKIGFSVEIPPKNSPKPEENADADVIATFEAIKTIIYIQVKKHDGVTSNHSVKQIMPYKDLYVGNDDDDYSKIAWVISTCDDFEEGAKELAKEEKVRLINGLDFAEMILDAGLERLEI